LENDTHRTFSLAVGHFRDAVIDGLFAAKWFFGRFAYHHWIGLGNRFLAHVRVWRQVCDFLVGEKETHKGEGGAEQQKISGVRSIKTLSAEQRSILRMSCLRGYDSIASEESH
jgi:hypothetical protein